MGANDSATVNDVRMTAQHPDKKVDVCAIDNNEITAIPLVTAEGVSSTATGEVVLVVHQHAYHEKKKTKHSSTQIEHHSDVIDDRSIKVCGEKYATTLDKYETPMSIMNALPCPTLS